VAARLTGDDIPDYPALVDAALVQVGYALVAGEDGVFEIDRIDQGSGGTIQFK
jgi:hypothetical protein